jgi:hypothetical protein
MPVRKFRSVEDMKEPRWRPAGDPELARAFAGLLEIGRRARPRHFPPGVHRYASIEAMQQAQDRWAEDHTPPRPT